MKDSMLSTPTERAIQCHADPLVFYEDNVVSPVECRYIIHLAKNKLERSIVSSDEGKGVISAGRTGSNCWLAYKDDISIRSIGQRIADRLGLPLENAEAFQVIHYGPEQEYRAHFDAYDLRTERGQRCCRNGGQRLVTALVYLNNVPGGGSTGFPKLGITIKPVLGRLLVFRNTALDDISKPHPQSLHAGNPVIEGEKWAFNMWFRVDAMTKVMDFSEYTTEDKA